MVRNRSSCNFLGFGFCHLLFAFEISGPAFSFFTFIILFAHKNLYFANTIQLFSWNMKTYFVRFNTNLWLLIPALAVYLAN